jgi:hypothetical protein
LSDNAATYSYIQNKSIDEPWHWEYRPSAPSAQASGAESLPKLQFRPDTPEIADSISPEFTSSSEATISSNRLELRNTPLLAKHRGTQPDLILHWNEMIDPTAVDVVIHLHGYSEDYGSMRLRSKEAYSGLDFSNPEDKSDTRRGRSQPTLCILPRGSYAGDSLGVKDKRTYVFPALVTKSGVQTLIDYCLDKFHSATGVDSSVGRNRFILTAHSGGGLPLMQILAHNYVPDEIQVFDALYWDASPLIKWVQGRIDKEIKAWKEGKQRSEGGLCIFYRTKKGTGSQSIRVQKAIDAAIGTAPADAQSVLHAAYRVFKTPVDHGEIPRKFGWLLLGDISQTLPDVNPSEESVLLEA